MYVSDPSKNEQTSALGDTVFSRDPDLLCPDFAQIISTHTREEREREVTSQIFRIQR